MKNKEEKQKYDIDGTLSLPLEDFINFWSFYDTKEVYTNCSRLISKYRLKQWIDYHIYKNDIDNNNIKISKED